MPDAFRRPPGGIVNGVYHTREKVLIYLFVF